MHGAAVKGPLEELEDSQNPGHKKAPYQVHGTFQPLWVGAEAWAFAGGYYPL